MADDLEMARRRAALGEETARSGFLVGILNMVLVKALNIEELHVSPAGGWLEFTLKRPLKPGLVIRLQVQERDGFTDGGAKFPVERTEHESDT